MRFPPDRQIHAGINPLCSHLLPLATNRREFLQRTGMSLGALALGTLFTDFLARSATRAQLDLVRRLNERHMMTVQPDEKAEARFESFEMQTAATDAFDVAKEPKAIHEAYGRGELAAKLLCARRLAACGVRFLQVDAGGWDHHSNLVAGITKTSQAVDQPAAALTISAAMPWRVRCPCATVLRFHGVPAGAGLAQRERREAEEDRFRKEQANETTPVSRLTVGRFRVVDLRSRLRGRGAGGML